MSLLSKSIKPAATLLLAASFVGCAAQKTMPHMGIGQLSIEAQLDRDDFVFLKTAEGTSTIASYLFGLVSIIDGDKVRVLGINFFTDKFTYFEDPLFGPFSSVGAVDRAYYRALEKTPDADVVLSKSMDREESGFIGIYSTTKVTFRGKAFQIKSDK